MFDLGDEHGFYVRSDGSFYAFIDQSVAGDADPVLKSETKEQNKVYPFIAIASTADRDREGEIIVQKGLNFAPFADHGEFNFNHISTAMTGVPTGKKAWFAEDGWRCQGEIVAGLPILPGYDTDMMVTQHNQLKKSGFKRGLCVSIEGKVKGRSKCGKYVLKADVYNIAHTFRPQNPNCTLNMLTKAMSGQTPILERDGFYERLDKSLSVQAIQPMTKEDLEGGSSNPSLEDRLVGHLVKKGMNKLKAKKYVYDYLAKKFPSK